MTTAAGTAWKIIPEFDCKCIKATIKFYTEELCFSSVVEEPIFCSLGIGEKANLKIDFIELVEGDQFKASSASIGLGTPQVDDFYDHLVQRGKVKITQPALNEEWGYRQFVVEDNDGNVLTFFEFLDDEERLEEDGEEDEEGEDEEMEDEGEYDGEDEGDEKEMKETMKKITEAMKEMKETMKVMKEMVKEMKKEKGKMK